MIAVSATIEGVDELVQRFGTLQMQHILRPPMLRGILEIQAAMQEYPAPPPNSKYLRGIDAKSEQLGKRWTHRVYTEPGSIFAAVGNNASYAPYVQNFKFQAKIHKRRWITDKEAMTKYLPGIVEDFQRVIRRALEE